MNAGKAIGVIPARWGSTRFPGKSLALIAGKPLIVRVVEQAMKARRLERVVVATDDLRIARAVESCGVHVAMTRPDHPSGTDRVAEAVRGVEAEVIVNVQGDEPLVDPGLIDRLAEVLLQDANWDMATAASPIREVAHLSNPAIVKVVWDRSRRALYFSRWAIPFVRDGDAASVPHWRHIGIYAYRRAFLDRMVADPPCALERAEKLEQLRALDMGGRMVVLETDSFDAGVDTPADVQYVEAALRRQAEGR